MAKGRVQVPDLSPPEPIRPINPNLVDNYSRPAPPADTSNWDRLAHSLGVLNQGVQAYMAKHKQDLAHQQLAEWERLKQSVTTDKLLKMWYAGEIDTPDEPVIAAAMSKDIGTMEGHQFAASMDEHVRAGIPGFGMEPGPNGTPFNPEQYANEKAAEVFARLKNNPMATLAFGDQLDVFKRNFIGNHKKLLSGERTLIAEGKVQSETSLVITSAMAQPNATPQGIMAALSERVYKDLGPRQKGGSWGVQERRTDDLVLSVLDRFAANPKYAEMALNLLVTPRAHEDGTLHTLEANPRLSQKALAVAHKARAALAATEKEKAQAAIDKEALDALRRGDGSIHAIKDREVPNKWDPSTPSKQNAKLAVQRATAQLYQDAHAAAVKSVESAPADQRPQAAAEAAKVAQSDVDLQLMKNGLDVPDLDMLKTTVGGLAGMNIAKDGLDPGASEEIIRAGTRFIELSHKNREYLQEKLPKRVFQFFDNYATLVSIAGRDPRLAAAEIAQWNAGDRVPPEISGSDVETAVGNLDLSVGNFPSSSWFRSIIDSGVNNVGDLRGAITKLAKVYASMKGISGEEALNAAVQKIEQNAVMINRFGIVDPYIHPGDEQAVYSIVKEFWRANKLALKNQGITGHHDLSLKGYGNGTYAIVTSKEVGGMTAGSFVLGFNPKTKTSHTARFTLADLRKRAAEIGAGHFDETVAYTAKIMAERKKALAAPLVLKTVPGPGYVPAENDPAIKARKQLLERQRARKQ